MMRTRLLDIPEQSVYVTVSPYSEDQIQELIGTRISINLEFDFFEFIKLMNYDIEMTYDQLIFDNKACLTDYSFELVGCRSETKIIIKLTGVVEEIE